MIDASILPAIAVRLGAALAPPAMRLRPFCIGEAVVGRLDDRRAAVLADFGETFVERDDAVLLSPRFDTFEARNAALAEVARALSAAGHLTAWRDERYAVATDFGAPPFALLERCAARFFGLRSYAVHVNGWVDTSDGPKLWFARRSAAKAIDPGMLDNLIGGGVAHGTSIAATLAKEAFEEAGIDAALAATAVPTGPVRIFRAQPDGIHHEALFVHDLALPAAWVPANQDGEVVGHRLVDMNEAARLISLDDGPDQVTADASLVVLDFLIRHGAIRPDQPHYLQLEALRHRPLVAGTG